MSVSASTSAAETTAGTAAADVIRTVDLTKAYPGTDFKAVDALNLTRAPRARSSACSARTAPARPRPPAC